MSMKIQSVMVANRGEVAARIVRTLNELSIRTVVPHSPWDVNGDAVRLADTRIPLKNPSKDFNDRSLLIELAKTSGVDAVHPGYGFLSEDPEFARLLEQEGIGFIGPSSAAMSELGSKSNAKQLADTLGVPTAASIPKGQVSKQSVRDFADQHGYPFAFKDVEGGGGRGISVVHDDEELDEYLQIHGDESGSVTGVIVEAFVTDSRHVETQCARDGNGNFQVISTRECSVQRRKQKVLEEAPAPFLSRNTNSLLEEYSKRLFDDVDYQGVGTCEFLVDQAGELYFLEVNPRLQVEHTVSEELTGIDIVELQLLISNSEELPDVPVIRGHSIEVRLTAEDSHKGLRPSTGTVTNLRLPRGLGTRVESDAHIGSTIREGFDPVVAKLVATAPTRKRAIRKMERCLNELVCEGFPTSLDVLKSVLSHEDFKEGRLSTGWLEEKVLPELETDDCDELASEAECDDLSQGPSRDSNHTSVSDWQQMGGGALQAQPRRNPAFRNQSRPSETEDETTVKANQGCTISKIAVVDGAEVDAGSPVLVTEAMKMEQTVYANKDGVITLHVSTGQTVSAGDNLFTIEEVESE